MHGAHSTELRANAGVAAVEHTPSEANPVLLA